jgi:hypothetical protein
MIVDDILEFAWMLVWVVDLDLPKKMRFNFFLVTDQGPNCHSFLGLSLISWLIIE